MSKEVKDIDLRECSNCAVFGVPLLACGRCMLVRYCSRDCQKQHYKNGHKKECIAVADRKPDYTVNPIGKEQTMCSICLCIMETEECVLPCGHKFHVTCVQELRKHSLQCPLCREELPNTPEKANSDCFRRYYAIILAHQKTGEPMDEMKAAKLVKEWTMVAEQGHSQAQFMVGLFHLNGWLYVSKDVKKAESWFEKASTPNALVNLGFILSSNGDVKGAMLAYEKAIKIDPANATAHFNLGVWQFRVGMFTEAIESFRVVVRIEPTNADAFYNLGITMQRCSFKMGAIAYFQRALQIDPKHMKAAVALEKCRHPCFRHTC
jgi:TPR repeat/MYND finger/Ring finger domain/Sel1 repeat